MDPYSSNREVITCNSELKPPDNKLFSVAFQAPFRGVAQAPSGTCGPAGNLLAQEWAKGQG